MRSSQIKYGELTIDFPEDVQFPVEPNQMVTAEVVGSQVKFSYCRLERGIALLKEQLQLGVLRLR